MGRTLGAVLAVLLLSAGACRTGRALLDRSEEDDHARGTIGGILRGVGGGDSLPGRRVEAVEVRTGTRHASTTSVTGGFSIQVPPGEYRLEVELHEGEALVKDPGTIDIGPSDLDANIELEVGRDLSSPPPPGR